MTSADVDARFDYARRTFFARNQTAFLSAGFTHLLQTAIPSIVETHCHATAVVQSLLYKFSITNVKVFNSGLTPSQCIRHALSLRCVVTGDFELTVAPLLAEGYPEHPPVVLCKQRAPVFYCPIPTGHLPLSTAATKDECPIDRALPDGIFIANGRNRTISLLKSMLMNTMLLRKDKKRARLQCRSAHDGNKTLLDCNPFRSTSSIEFEVQYKRLKRQVNEGLIGCKLPFSKQKHDVHIGVLAQAFGCDPQQFIELVKSAAGLQYDAPTFRAYEINILHDQRMYDMQLEAEKNGITPQEAAILQLSMLNTKTNKSVLSAGNNLLKTEIFPHINLLFDRGDKTELYFAKLYFLALCTARLILFVAGKLSDTSRDLWQHAHYHVPSSRIGTLIRSRVTQYVICFQKLLRREIMRVLRKPPHLQQYPSLHVLWAEERLSDTINRAILTGTFSQKQLGVAIALNDNNHAAMWTQLFRIAASMNTTDSVNVNPRRVQHDGYGYGCAGSTPDGEQVGLINEIACTATVTTELEDPYGLSELIVLLMQEYLIDMLTAFGAQRPAATTTTSAAAVREQQEATAPPNQILSKAVALVQSMKFHTVPPGWYVFINHCGVPTHFVRPEHVTDFIRTFRRYRRNNTLHRHVFLSVTHVPPQIRILCEGGLMTRPLIVLENIHKASTTMSFNDMVHHGIIEWVTPAEEQTICKGAVAMCLDDVRTAIQRNEMSKLSHLEFTQAAFVGVLAASVVFLTSEQGPRLALYEHQMKQLMTAVPKKFRGSIQSTRLWYPHKDLVFTKLASMIHGMKDGYGVPCVVAIKAEERNQEDALIIMKQAIERGLLVAETTRYYASDLMPSKSGVVQKFEKPKEVLSKKNLRYDTICEDGFPRKRQRVGDEGEVVIGKTRTSRKPAQVQQQILPTTANNNTSSKRGDVSLPKSKDMSTTANPSVQTSSVAPLPATATVTLTSSSPPTASAGTSSRFPHVLKHCLSHVSRRNEGGEVRDFDLDYTLYTIRGRIGIVTTQWTREGNKVTTDKGQKGVFGLVVSAEDMPFSEISGMIPEILVSSIGLTSRMTMGSITEGIIGKAVSISGKVQLGEDSHDYCNEKSKRKRIEDASKILTDAGWVRTGGESLRSGITGALHASHIFMGVIKYGALVHLASNKLHFYAEGPRCPLTRQPKQGKKDSGGLRFGEQEGAAALGQGAAAFIQSRFRDLSDPFFIFVCQQCQFLADGNRRTDYAWCRNCRRRDSVHMVKVPFTFLLNMYELMAIGVKMGIRIKPFHRKPLLLTHECSFMDKTILPPKTPLVQDEVKTLHPVDPSGRVLKPSRMRIEVVDDMSAPPPPKRPRTTDTQSTPLDKVLSLPNLDVLLNDLQADLTTNAPPSPSQPRRKRAAIVSSTTQKRARK